MLAVTEGVFKDRRSDAAPRTEYIGHVGSKLFVGVNRGAIVFGRWREAPGPSHVYCVFVPTVFLSFAALGILLPGLLDNRPKGVHFWLALGSMVLLAITVGMYVNADIFARVERSLLGIFDHGRPLDPTSKP